MAADVKIKHEKKKDEIVGDKHQSKETLLKIENEKLKNENRRLKDLIRKIYEAVENN